MNPQDIVITGLGAVGGFGNSPSELWEALQARQPSWLRSQRLDGNPLSAEMSDFDLNNFRRTVKGHRVPRISQYALAAAAQAITHARLDAKGVDKDAVSVVYGTGNGPNDVVGKNLLGIVTRGLGGVEPLSFQESVFNAPASLISIEYGFRGPLLALPMGWAAGGHAIAMAADLIRFGHTPVAVVVASDESTALGHRAIKALGMVTPNDGGEEAIRPFDVRHNGGIIGEGASALVIETLAHAQARAAIPLMRLTGWAMSADTFGTGAKGKGKPAIREAMASALQMADRSQVDLIYAGSYCTTDADQAEAEAMIALFGRAATPPITNIRGAIGEQKGVSALFNAVAACQSLQTGVMPATIGCEQIDPACAVDVVLAERAGLTLDAVLCNAFWVNGANAAFVLEAVQS
jgi:3-oxoacyl-(acyl-carrier-protein) synthase